MSTSKFFQHTLSFQSSFFALCRLCYIPQSWPMISYLAFWCSVVENSGLVLDGPFSPFDLLKLFMLSHPTNLLVVRLIANLCCCSDPYVHVVGQILLHCPPVYRATFLLWFKLTCFHIVASFSSLSSNAAVSLIIDLLHYTLVLKKRKETSFKQDQFTWEVKLKLKNLYL